MGAIHVCALDHVPEVLARCGARDLVTLLREDHPFQRPAGIAPERYLRLAFNDIVAPREGLTLARAEHLGALLAFLRRWPREAPLLIHCFAGVSRSTAAAFIAACALAPARKEAFWATRLRALSPPRRPMPISSPWRMRSSGARGG